MEQILDEIQYQIYTLDLPIREIMKKIKTSNMCIPKRGRRWTNFLMSNFHHVSFEVPYYCLDVMCKKLHQGVVVPFLIPVYHSAIFTAYNTGNAYKIFIKTNTTELFNELLRRKILCICGHRTYMNIY